MPEEPNIDSAFEEALVYGTSMSRIGPFPMSLEVVQMALDALHNQRLDNIRLSLSPIWWVRDLYSHDHSPSGLPVKSVTWCVTSALLENSTQKEKEVIRMEIERNVAQLGIDLNRILTLKVEALPDRMGWKFYFYQRHDAPTYLERSECGKSELARWFERMEAARSAPPTPLSNESPEFLHPGEEQ